MKATRHSKAIRHLTSSAVFAFCLVTACEKTSNPQGKPPKKKQAQVRETPNDNQLSGIPSTKSKSTPEGYLLFIKFEKLRHSAPEAAYASLQKSAALEYPPACAELAVRSSSPHVDLSEFGKTRDLAVRNLLSKAPDYDNKSKLKLALLLKEGSEEVRDHSKSRKILRNLSYSFEPDAWLHYSNMCYRGEGGDIDLQQAYFFLSAVSLVTGPSWPTGEKISDQRESLAIELDQATLSKIITNLDSMIEKRGLPLTSLSLGRQPPEIKAILAQASEADRAHRRRHSIPERE